MLLWESFDNVEKKRQDNLKKQADLLKKRQIELEEVKEEAKKTAYAEAWDKANEDFLLKKEHAFKELTSENAQQIKNIHDMIEKSAKDQSLHYAKLLAGIIEHFMPKMCENISYNQVSEALSFILKGCDQRHLVVAAHNKTLERFMQLISCETRRIELLEQDDLSEGLIKVSYEGGGADMDLTQYRDQAIKSLSEMLGYDLSLPKEGQKDKAEEDNVNIPAISDMEHSTPNDSIMPDEQEQYDALEPVIASHEEIEEENLKIKQPLFQDFEEEVDDDSKEISH